MRGAPFRRSPRQNPATIDSWGLRPKKPVSHLLQQTAHFFLMVKYIGNDLEHKVENTKYTNNLRKSQNPSLLSG